MKKATMCILDMLGINLLFRKLIPRNSSIVLMYHGVVKDEDISMDGNWAQVKESEFYKQMLHLKKNYNVVHLKDVIKGTFKNVPGKPKVVITFDDGYMNNYTVAYPILKKLKIPATIFVVTGRIDVDKFFWYDRIRVCLIKNGFSLDPLQISRIINSFKDVHPHKIDDVVDEFLKINYNYSCDEAYNDMLSLYGTLTWDAINDMCREDLIHIDAHTHLHEIVTEMSAEGAEDTIYKSMQIIRDKVPHKNVSNIFCFPNGWFSDIHKEMVKNFGYNGAVSTINKRWDHDRVFSIPRIGIGQNLSIREFKCHVTGYWSKIFNVVKHIKGKQH